MIIAITGKSGSGKDTVANILEERGFKKYSCSNIIREECQKQNIPPTRENLIKLGNALRQQFGNDYLGKQIAKKIQSEKPSNAVICSIRHPEEILPLRPLDHFKLLNIEAPLETRFKRTIARKSATDNISLETFEQLEERELNGTGPSQQIKKVIEQADITLENNTTLEDLKKKLAKALGWSRFKKERDEWNTYFMKIADQVSTRSTCDRAHTGAVIVKDKTILSTGYNGSIKGLPHCDDIGHTMEAGHCIATVHAEANAIAQAAKNGVSIEGSEIYVTKSPCWLCFKMIINSGIKKITYNQFYRDERVQKVAKELGIQLNQISIVPPDQHALPTKDQ